MRIPGFGADLSLVKSKRSYGGGIVGARVASVMIQQNIAVRLPRNFPPLVVDCDWQHRICELGCGVGYLGCVRGGGGQPPGGLVGGVVDRCSQRYFACSDDCDVQCDKCRHYYHPPPDPPPGP